MRRVSIGGGLGLILASAMGVIGCADQDPNSVAASKTFTVGETMPPRPREEAAAAADTPENSATAGRKIIYNATVDLVTEDLSALDSALASLIAANQAYVADSDRTGSAGATRRGLWKIRVPVDHYAPFLKGVGSLGELVSQKANSQDVSEEFFDLDARQVAKKVEENRLLKHLTDSTGKLEEILTVERELSRVRTEIERMQGRLRTISNLAALATVTVTASEIKGYIPPQAPTLGTRLARSFAGSVEVLQQLGESLLIGAAALVPWLPLVALALGFLAWRFKQGSVPPPPTALIDPAPSLRSAP